MNEPTVSVVIPAYNGAKHIGDAIQSVLDQTYQDFELIVVDDVSTDHTSEIVNGFDDPRITYLLHKKNRGAIAARNTGMRASQGEIIAFLDQDDLFHPNKLQTHVNFYEEHPKIGLTYNSRFELNYSSETIREIRQPPQDITLADLTLGFPITPSDMVIRREWALLDEIWDDSFITSGSETVVNGGEYVLLGHLWLTGCKFASIDQTLNYRRHQSMRVFSDLAQRCKSELTCQEIIFSDRRCPDYVTKLRHIAFMNTYLVWAIYAFTQNETSLGQKFVREAILLDPSITSGKPAQLIEQITHTSIADENLNHGTVLKRIFDQLPPELTSFSKQYNWAVATGYLLKGARAIIWDRPDDGDIHFTRAAELGAILDEAYLRKLADQLINYETEFGYEALQRILQLLIPQLEKIKCQVNLHRLTSLLLINQAFKNYQRGEFSKVPIKILEAIVNDPKQIMNRGVLSIAFRSTINSLSFTQSI